MAQQRIDLNPGISGVRAIVTTRWGGHAYRPRIINSVEQYTIDSAMDSDADTWSIDIADPYGDMVDALERDSEVRVQLFGVGNSPDYIMTGFADTVDFDETGTMTLAGRDMSAIAMDSTVPPLQLRHVRGWAVVDQQAKELGFVKTKLAHGQMIRKVAHTDGSESYWEFWYRLYRREKMWIWCEPDGTLRADFLDYGGNPNYWLGTPKSSDSARIKAAHIPVELISVRKNTQPRIAETYVYFHKGKTGSHQIAIDPTMRSWQKRPRRIILDSNARTNKGAMKSGWEEIFEGKVGELEYTVTIPDPSFLLRQNTIARLRVPELNLSGEFFVVGVQAQVGPNGATQVVRLRDRRMALTRRIPSEPKAISGSTPKKETVQTSMGLALTTELPVPWGSYFFNAAKQFYGPWDFNLFLACLLAICDHSTGFTNIRELTGHHDREEWHKKPTAAGQPPTVYATTPENPGKVISGSSPVSSAIKVWEETFANDKDTVEAMGIAHKDLGVGPMQIYLPGDKKDADNYSTTSTAVAPTVTSAKIDAYYKTKNSPLFGTGDTYVQAGQANGVDPRLGVAISGAETSFATDPNAGSDITTGHNAWGYGPHHVFGSWEEGIQTIYGDLGTNYIGQGLTTVAAIQQKWAPGGAANDPNNLNANWRDTVTRFLQDLGGNPNDVTYKGSPDGQQTTKQATASGVINQYEGGRWNPQSNIWIGAKHLRDCLDALGGSGKDDEIWMGVMAYHIGVQEALAYFNKNNNVDSWTKAVRVMVNTDPGYLATVKTARDQGQQDAGQPVGTGPNDIVDQPPAPAPGKVNSDAAINSLKNIQRESSGVNLANVDWRLLVAVNNLGKSIGKIITITSGFRTFADQVKAWDDMGHNPLLAANPYTTTSNHQKGEAVDCTIGGTPIGQAVPQATMEKYGIHCSVYIQYGTDPVHVTLLGVWH